MISPRDEQRPVDVEGVPAEEGVSTADAADRVDADPREQRNYTDTHPQDVPPTGESTG